MKESQVSMQIEVRTKWGAFFLQYGTSISRHVWGARSIILTSIIVCQLHFGLREGMLTPKSVIGSELCTAVETMFSMSYLYHTLGDNYFADQCERAAFNALPVSITADHWAHQYLAVASEPYVNIISGDNPFWNVRDTGIIYGLGKTLNSSFYPPLTDQL